MQQQASDQLLSDAPQINLLDLETSKWLAEALHEAYPGHLWAVTCEGEKGIATVRNLALAGSYGFVLHLANFYSGSELKRAAIMAGGEVLERYKVSRGRACADEIASLPTDFAGRILGDVS